MSRDIEESLKSLGIPIKNPDGKRRDIFDVLEDLSRNGKK